MSNLSESILKMSERELENGDWAIVYRALVDAQVKLTELGSGRQSWIDAPIAIAKERSETSSAPTTDKVLTPEIKEVLREAAQVVAWRNGDVSTEDGNFATTDTDAIIRLEQALCTALKTSSDDVVLEEILPMIEVL